MIKMLVVLWLTAVLLYTAVYAFNKSPNKLKILKRIVVGTGFLSLAAIILSLITILF